MHQREEIDQGGVVVELFKDLLGAHKHMNTPAGMTGTLSVRCRRPTPLMTPLDREAHLVRGEGRKIYTHGEIAVDGVVTAEADGSWRVVTYVTAWHERWEGLRETLCLRYLDRVVADGGEYRLAERRVHAAVTYGFEGVPWVWVPRQVPEGRA